jgi:hypothetical protein
MAEDNIPTNVVDNGIELYHSRSKGIETPRDFHAGTYQAAVDRSAFMFGDTNMYQLIINTQELAQEQVNDMLSEIVSDSTGKFEDGKYLEREILVDLPNGNQQPVNVLVETIDDTGGYKVMILDKDNFGFTIYSQDGFGEAPANKSLLEVNGNAVLVGEADDTFGYVAGFKPENKTFNYKDGYELYKVEIKPNANVVTFTGNIELVENGVKQNIDPDLFVNYLEMNLLTDIDSITLPDGKTIDLQGLSDTEKRNKLKNNIDVIGYRNQMEDVGSTSYYFLNNDAYTETLVDNATNTKYDNDVLKKFINTNPNVGITDFKRASDERLNIVTDLLSSKTDTPTNVVDDVIKNKGTINEWFNEAVKEYNLVSGTPTGRKDLLRYSDFEKFLINNKGLNKKTAEKIIKDIKTGVVTQVELGPTTTTGISPEFAKATGLTDIGISQNVFRDFGVQNYLDTVYTQASDLSSSAYNMSFADRQALQNTFYDSLINSDDVVEIYLRQVSSVNVPAESVYFRPELVQEVPGFYTEPIGGLSPGDMASGGGINPTENYYKLEVNKNNLLIDVPGVDFSNELKTKLDWNLLNKELGIRYSQFKNIDNYQLFHTKLSNVANDLGIDNTKLYSTLRKSGYEGTVGYVNRQVEVVLLDPNDDLGIGKKVNFENSTIDDFYNNNQTVNQLDELVIKPTNVVDDVTPASVVDEAVEYVDNLNIDNAIKKEIKNKVIKVTGQASGAIPIPGVGQAIDFWETAVLVVGAAALAAGEIDELPKVIYNYGLDLYESILSGYNIPFQPAKRKEYNPNFERISSGLTWIDKLQPTSYLINPVIEEFQETAETTPTMEVPGFGTVPYSEYYQPPVQSTPERDNINTIMTNLMTDISNAQGAYPRTRREIELFGRNPIQVVPQDTADKPEKVEYDSKEKQNLHDMYANMLKALSESLMR